MEVKSFKNVLDIIDLAIVDNNAKFDGILNLENIRNYLLAKWETETVKDMLSLPGVLSQINAIKENHFRFTNLELKDDYIQLRKLVLEWFIELKIKIKMNELLKYNDKSCIFSFTFNNFVIL